MLPAYSLSELSVLAFVVIPLALAAALVLATEVAWRRAGEPPARERRAALGVAVVTAAWMTLTLGAASSGILLDVERTPPPFAVLFAGILVLGGALAFSGLGKRLARHIPLWILVGVQGFRLPLELAMHRMAERGIMPEQMSYAGWNFDIITGITALIVAALVWAGRAGRTLVAVWNVVGLGLLVNIMAIAIVSTPRFGWFGPDRLNVWVMHAPFVWLPAVMVLAALAGHLVVFRALAMGRAPDDRTPATGCVAALLGFLPLLPGPGPAPVALSLDAPLAAPGAPVALFDRATHAGTHQSLACRSAQPEIDARRQGELGGTEVPPYLLVPCVQRRAPRVSTPVASGPRA